ncbi:MAG TPA: F0F1 ATP synthase subunit epsilon [Anaerolineales bacterium]|nr:F0F1 ATP synthase subunit epsilon [Anaerolineales bacterium]
MTIRCEIVSQDRTVFQGDVDIVVLPGVTGEMGILPHHAPLLAILKYGVIKIRQNGKEQLFAVAGGMAEVQPDIITILADAAENVQDIDVTRAQAAKKRAEDALANIKPEDQDAYLRMESALRRSNLRLDAVRRYRRTRDTYTEQDASM